MAKAYRHYLVGQIWHWTHRCHESQFLLKFARYRQFTPNSPINRSLDFRRRDQPAGRRLAVVARAHGHRSHCRKGVAAPLESDQGRALANDTP